MRPKNFIIIIIIIIIIYLFIYLFIYYRLDDQQKPLTLPTTSVWTR